MVYFLDSCLGLVLDYSIRLGTICDGYCSGLGCCASNAKLELKIQLFGKGYVELHQQVDLTMVSYVLLLHCARERHDAVCIKAIRLNILSILYILVME